MSSVDVPVDPDVIADSASTMPPPVGTGGLALRVRRLPGLPLVSLRVLLRGGITAEPIPGLSLVTSRMLAEGSRRRGWQRIAADVENRGMYLHAGGSGEGLSLTLDALAGDWRLALDWLAELALEPAFPEDRLQFVRRQVAAELESLLDQPDARTSLAFVDQLYHPHPLARPTQGDPDGLASIGPADCIAFHRRAMAWGGCVTVAGDIDEDEVTAALEQVFAPLAGQAQHGDAQPVEPWPAVPAPTGRDDRRRQVDLGPGEQAHLFLGHLTVPRRHPDLLALELAGVVLGAGAGLSGRLPKRVRDQLGLAYQVSVATVARCGLAPGRFQVYVGTGPDRLVDAEAAVREEVERFVADGPTDDEVAEARSYLLGREPFRRETLRQWSDLMTIAEFYGLPEDHPTWRMEQIEALDQDDVVAAVQRWIRPDDLRVTIGRPS